MSLSIEVWHLARALIARRLGLDFSQLRRADLEREFARILGNLSPPAVDRYLDRLASLPDDSPEWGRLAGELTVGETYFFRDHACFEALEREILPTLIATRRAEGILRLRLWSAGCATGEEPYSLAILIDRLLPDRWEWTVTVLATDINPKALEAAHRGLYREWSFRETPQWIRDCYFRPRGKETFELDPRIRQMVAFVPLNLAQECYPAVMTNTNAMDLILCRNVIMYFTRDAQQATLSRLQDALVSGGWLAVSPAEAAADLVRPLVLVQFPWATFFRKEPRDASDEAASLPTRTLAQWPAEASVPVLDLAAVVPDTPCDPPVFPQVQMQVHAAATPPETEPILERARAFADRGRLEEAYRLCQTALGRDRLDVEAHLMLAAVCQEREDIPAALEALRRAIYLDPDSASANFLLGSLLFRQGHMGRARRCMETVVTLLCAVPRDEPVRGSGGLTAGRLLETAQGYLAMGSSPSGDSKPSDTQGSRPRNDDPKADKLTGARQALAGAGPAQKGNEP